MKIRYYHPEDTAEIVSLFRDTIRAVNRRDYSDEQVRAWAPNVIDEAAWSESLAANHTLVAEIDGAIAGFADLRPDGCLHRLFAHKDRQGQGIATALVARLEAEARKRGLTRLTTEASITARPFFERRGFQVITRQEVQVRGQTFVNYRMEKALRPA